MIGSGDWWCRGFLVSNWRYLQISINLSSEPLSRCRYLLAHETGYYRALHTHTRTQYTTHYTHTNTEPRVLLRASERRNEKGTKQSKQRASRSSERAREREQESTAEFSSLRSAAAAEDDMALPPTHTSACLCACALYVHAAYGSELTLVTCSYSTDDFHNIMIFACRSEVSLARSLARSVRSGIDVLRPRSPWKRALHFTCTNERMVVVGPSRAGRRAQAASASGGTMLQWYVAYGR